MHYKNIINHKTTVFLTILSTQLLLSSASYSQKEITHGPSPFNRAIIFGDSLSDNGQFDGWDSRVQKKVDTQLTNGRFSNGIAWDEYLFSDQKRGIGHIYLAWIQTPLWAKTGDFGDDSSDRNTNLNYSVGGATYSSGGGIKGWIKHTLIPTISDQLDAYLDNKNGSPNRISPDSIIALWAGSNDALDTIERNISPHDKASFVRDQLRDALEQLYQAGGRNFLIPDFPDFGWIPRFNKDSSALPHEAMQAFNKAIADAVADFSARHSDASLYAPDMNGFLDTAMRYPELFGYKNTADACIKIAACKNAPTGSEAQNEFMFWDGIHPTTRTHHYIANYMREYWLNPDLAGFYVTSPEGQYQTERNFFFPVTDTTVSDYLTGDKSVYKLNNGKLTFTGDHSYTGGTFIKNGELELGDGGTTGSVTGNIDIAKQAFLSFNRNNLFALDNIISGDGGVNQKGSGLTIINSHNSYRGPTDILAGELMINGSVASQVNVYSRGILSGLGSTGDLFAEKGSVVSPGDFRTSGTGTLTVNGNAELKKGSTLDIRVNADGTTSVLNAKGRINLGGIVLFSGGTRGTPLTVAETLAMLGKTGTFLKSDTGIQGQFEEVKPDYRFIGANLDYKSREVDVTFSRTDQHFSAYATNRNQAAVANAAEALHANNRLNDNIAVSTFEDNLSAAYEQLSGDLFASLQTSLLLDSYLTRDAVQKRMADAFDTRLHLPSQGLNAPHNSGMWALVYSATARMNSDGNAQDMKRSLTGFVTGIDNLADDNWHIGLFTSYMRSSLHSGNASAAIDTYQLGAYGGREWDELKLIFGAAANLHDIKSRRALRFKEINDSNRADFRATSYQTFAELSYTFDTQAVQITPFTGVAYSHVKTGRFTENARISSLTGSENTADLFSTTLGLRLGQVYALSDTLSLGTSFSAGWQHNSKIQPSAQLRFTGGNAFAIDGLAPERDSLLLQAGLQLNLRQNTSLGLSYQGQLAKRTTDHTVKADFTYRF